VSYLSESTAGMQLDADLSNADIAPVPISGRRWKSINFFALWVGMAVCIPTYMIAASLIQGGMNWQQAMLTVLAGNCIVLIPMLLSGHAGARYGIPFPVFARAAFGIKGSNIPALLRAMWLVWYSNLDWWRSDIHYCFNPCSTTSQCADDTA